MEFIIFLIIFPFILSLFLLIPSEKLRNVLVRVGSGIIIGTVIIFAFFYLNKSPMYFHLEIGKILDKILFGSEFIIGIIILAICIKHKKFLPSLFIILHLIIMTYYEINYAHEVKVDSYLYFDQFSIIMALIIGIIGTLVCVYAIGYMKDYHNHHKEVKDRSNFFFFILFAFLSAMFGVVFSNDIHWMHFFWEITTYCSFILIGYSKTEEATKNAFHALNLNMLGGLVFSIGFIYLFANYHTIELNKIIALKGTIALLPIALICFAGIVKSAQFPFSSWLLGAMVAPTPTSALLHSSTMVKAGVFLLIKFSPLLQNTVTGYMIAIIGGLTFLFAAFIAISQKNAKKVLAYSTISNLGLIVACAGIGSFETVWAALFLIIFHAIAKSLLFISVGVVEHKIASKDIEDMDNLMTRLPQTTVFIVIGISGMFIAPFGMLISKWAALEAFVNVHSIISPILILIISYGGAATIFFWTKWLGKIISINNLEQSKMPVGKEMDFDQWISLFVHGVLTVLTCVAFPLISMFAIEPYIHSIYNSSHGLGRSNVIIMIIMVMLIILLPLILMTLQKRKQFHQKEVYMGGRNVDTFLKFEGSMGVKKELNNKNYYLEKYFNEKKINDLGIWLSLVAIIIMLVGIK